MKQIYRIILCITLSAILFCGCSKNENKKKAESIGIIGAMDIEVDSLKEAADVKEIVEIAGMEYNIGIMGDKHVVIVKCGMGKVNAGICANTLINDFGCNAIINTGVAGSLDDQMDIGDIVVSTDAVQHDFDTTYIGFEKGEIPYTGLFAFKADEKLIDTAVKAINSLDSNIHVYKGRVCTGDQFIHSEEQKKRIKLDFGGRCCEMEGGAIAQTSYLNDTPFVLLRVISDKVGETSEKDYKEFEDDAALKCANIVQYMVENFN